MLHVDKKSKFEMLVRNVDRCDLCSRMRGRCKVLSEKNGSIDSRVVFVGEAPGRLGADRTQVPFHGDQAGRNFERFLGYASLARQEVFITNALLCNPRDEKGNNASPTWQEVRNCSIHLSLVLEIVEPEFIVTLGQWALNALNLIDPHSIELRRDVRKPVKWKKYIVLPMYHTGPRAIAHRSAIAQIGDFYVLSEVLGQRKQQRLGGAQLPLSGLKNFEPSLAQKVIYRIVHRAGTVSKLKLMKLLYLLDWQEVKASGNVLTGCYYIFQKNGPLATGLSEALEEMDNHELYFRFQGPVPTYSPGNAMRADMDLPSNIGEKVDRLLTQCEGLNDSQIKTRAYLTDPMKDILRRQKRGERMLNHPIFEGWVPPKHENP